MTKSKAFGIIWPETVLCREQEVEEEKDRLNLEKKELSKPHCQDKGTYAALLHVYWKGF